MSKSPWFKFYASDYITDPTIDKLSLEGRAIVLHLWCLLWIHGRLPSDPKELARLIRIDPEVMHVHMQEVMQMLDADAEGNLYSERMDKEMARSESITFLRKKAANKRWNQQDNAHAYAKGHARMHKQTPMQSESESESESCSDSESKAKPLTTLPLNDSSEYAIYENQVSEWKSLYPAVDVAQSLRNMRGWCLSNPKNRKTKSGILRFINSWLAKEQNNTKGNGHAKQGYLDKLAALRSADGSYV